jgi:hypothetical protein
MTSYRELAERLGNRALDVCATYLSNGRRSGRYWLVGNVANEPGQSLYVRLNGPPSGPGAAGKWTDAATGEHGDLVDLIRLNRQLNCPRALREEIERFLNLPSPPTPVAQSPVPRNSTAAAARLFAAAQPVPGTLAEIYLRARGITCQLTCPSLRYHPGCYVRDPTTGARLVIPALLARVSDGHGNLTGLVRTFLAADGRSKANLPEPRLAMGHLLGHAVRCGPLTSLLAVGEGLESMLALKSLVPGLTIAAATSANHLAVFDPPEAVTRLFIAADNDDPGHRAAERLAQRCVERGILTASLVAWHDDWNTDLQRLPLATVLNHLRPQLQAFAADLDVLQHLPSVADQAATCPGQQRD